MKNSSYAISLFVTLASCAEGQERSLPDLVSQALVASPAVAARRAQVAEAEATARSLGSPKNVELDVAPGVGFTNSNFVLGQSFDLSGTRAARAQRARAEANVARAGLRKSVLMVGGEVLIAYASYIAAVANEANATTSVEVARATVAGVQKRIEIGEAPAVQLTRAEIELARAEQALVLARSERSAARAALNSFLGAEPTAGIESFAWTLATDNAASAQSRPEAMEATARIEAARASEQEARRAGYPSLFAGVAADTWSLDRRPFQRDNLGLQIRLSMPLFDQGEDRHAASSARAAREAREAELKDVQRRIALEVLIAEEQLSAARTVAKTYEGGIVPKADEMLKAMQAGFQSGLIGFLDVLEAQRTLTQLRREANDATKNLRIAEVRYLLATAQLPGLENPKP